MTLIQQPLIFSVGPERFCLIGRDNGQVTYDGRGFKILEDELKRLEVKSAQL